MSRGLGDVYKRQFYGGADYPFHQTGLSLGRCYTFGMLAAKHAMGK